MHKKDKLVKYRGQYKFLDDKSGFTTYSNELKFEKNAMVAAEWYDEPFEPDKYNLVAQMNYREKHEIKRSKTNAQLLAASGYVTWDNWDIPFGSETPAWNIAQTNNNLTDNDNIEYPQLLPAVDTPDGY